MVMRLDTAEHTNETRLMATIAMLATLKGASKYEIIIKLKQHSSRRHTQCTNEVRASSRVAFPATSIQAASSLFSGLSLVTSRQASNMYTASDF